MIDKLSYKWFKESVRGIMLIKTENEDAVVLIYREKMWRKYYVDPWGGVEPEEDKKQALKREMIEEVNSDVYVKKHISTVVSKFHKTTHYFYLCKHTLWEIKKGSWDEFSIRTNSDNIYEIKLLRRDEVLQANIVPEAIKPILLDVLDGKKVEYQIIFE